MPREFSSPLPASPSITGSPELFRSGRQVTFGFDCSRAAEARGRHRLPVHPVHAVTGNEYPGHIGRRAMTRNEVASVVHFNLAFEKLRVREQADSDKYACA